MVFRSSQLVVAFFLCKKSIWLLDIFGFSNRNFKEAAFHFTKSKQLIYIMSRLLVLLILHFRQSSGYRLSKLKYENEINLGPETWLADSTNIEDWIRDSNGMEWMSLGYGFGCGFVIWKIKRSQISHIINVHTDMCGHKFAYIYRTEISYWMKLKSKMKRETRRKICDE